MKAKRIIALIWFSLIFCFFGGLGIYSMIEESDIKETLMALGIFAAFIFTFICAAWLVKD